MSYWRSEPRAGTPASWSSPTGWSLDKKIECEPDCPCCAAAADLAAGWAEELYQEMTPEDEPITFEDAFSRIFDQAFDTLVDKQRAYGPENIKELDFFGTFSRLASDKINRIKNMMRGEVVNGTVYVQFPLDLEESVEDTLIDIMNYAAILIALRRDWWGKPLKEDE